MKTILDKATREALLTRIRTLDDHHVAQWGKMNVYQMVNHCARFEEMLLGKTKYKQVWIGRLFGKIALKSMMKAEEIKPNMPTIRELMITTRDGDLAAGKAAWIGLLQEYEDFTNDALVHPFFGKLKWEQAGVLAYKHTNHHLKQFGA